MDLPTYIKTESQENYNEELNQTLRDNLSDNGFVLPTITNTQLTMGVVINPSTGQETTLSNLMPDGTAWYVIDGASPPVIAPIPVIKVSGSLYKFTLTAYP